MIDAEMAARTWAMGEAFTLADCAAGPPLFFANKLMPFGESHRNLAAIFRASDPASVLRPLARRGRALHEVLSGLRGSDVLQASAPLDLAFQALADPTRRIMVERLSRGPASVSELARPLDMTLSAVVQHLAVLEASGLVRSEKVGRVRTCRIEPEALRTAERWISERRASWERRLDRLGEFLSETEPLAKPRRKDVSKRSTKHATFTIERTLCRAAGARVRRLCRRQGQGALVRRTRRMGRSRTSSSISGSAAARA